MYESLVHISICRLIYAPRIRTYISKILIKDLQWLFGRKVAISSVEPLSFETSFLTAQSAFGRESEVICCRSKVYDVFLYPVPKPQIEFLFAKCSWPCFFATPASSLGWRSPDVERNHWCVYNCDGLLDISFTHITVGEYCEIRSESDLLLL